MKTGTLNRILAVVLTVCVAAVIVRALFIIGPINEQRDRRFDQNRVADLGRISTALESYARQHDALPDSLGQLEQTQGYAVDITDPETGRPYGYTKQSGDTYELCAEFAMPSPDTISFAWAHPSGRHCFRLTVKFEQP